MALAFRDRGQFSTSVQLKEISDLRTQLAQRKPVPSTGIDCEGLGKPEKMANCLQSELDEVQQRELQDVCARP